MMELNSLTPSKNNGRGAGPPATIPLTPTIRLSEPPTPHHVDYNEPATISEGINNPAFVGDQEPLFSKSFVPRGKSKVYLSTNSKSRFYYRIPKTSFT